MPKGAGLTKPMKLSADLADIVGKKEASRAECIKQLWAYIKKNNLQDPENKQFFNPDKKMAKVLFSLKINHFLPRVLCNSHYGNGVFAPFANGILLNSDSNKIPFANGANTPLP